MKSKKNSVVRLALAALMLAGIGGLSSTDTFAQEKEEKANPKLARQAKITLDAARETALKNAAGEIESEELEREHGKLLYSFDIRNRKGTITEVQVDAKTGKLLSVQEESKQDEQREKQQDEKQAKKKSKKT